MSKNVVIDHRFCGPPDSGNGGYVCGVLAGFIDGAADVTLRQPPPLDRPLVVEEPAANRVLLREGDEIVAEAQSTKLELDVPNPPAYTKAKEAARRYRGFDYHPFPTCFVCGPERVEADGLRIFAGPVTGSRMVAAPWMPDVSLVDNRGHVRPEFLWAVLDCPGYFAALDDQNRSMVLGRLAAKIDDRIKPGEQCVVIGWQISKDGRKHYVGTALFSGSGELCGQAKATWIQVKELGAGKSPLQPVQRES